MLRTCGGFGDAPGEWAFVSGLGRGTSGGLGGERGRGRMGERGSGGVGVRGRRATVCRPPTPNCRLPFVHAHTHCTDPGVPLHPFGVRQSHLSDIGLFTPLGRARNSMPLRTHSPTLPCIFGISLAIRVNGASFVRRLLNMQSPWGVGAFGRVGERRTGDTTKICASPAPRVPLVQRTTFNAQRVRSCFDFESVRESEHR